MTEEHYDYSVFFDTSPDKFPWRTSVVKAIEKRRAGMADMLIFDILLSSGGIQDPDALYPPRDPDGLRQLLHAIDETSYDDLKKDCLVYFLLKWHKDGREDRFHEERCIPPQFVSLADAYWFLDSGEDVPRAVGLLADARLNRDYTSKILQAIALEGERSNALVLRYIRTAKPLLTEPDDIDAYSIALAESSLLEAWQYQRTFPDNDDVRSRILRNILRWCLTPKPRAKPLTQLLSLPLTNYEQTLLHSFAMNPPVDLPTASTPVMQDLACVRLIHGGQFAAAIKLDRQFSTAPIRGQVDDHARKLAQERRHLLEETLSIMPSAERQLIEIELDQISKNSGTPGVNNGRATDPSRSWEHIHSPKSNGATPARSNPSLHATHSTVVPIPQKSDAPRFGGAPAPRKVSASSAFTAVRDMFDSMSKATPSQIKPLSSADTDPLISSIEAPATGTPEEEDRPPSISANRTSTLKRKDPPSLFDSVGSANKAANAFYQPPSTSLPPTNLLPQDHIGVGEVSSGSGLDVSAILEEPVVQDVDMHNSDAEQDTPRARAADEEPPEFSISVFTTSAASSRRPYASTRAPISKRDAIKTPPGDYGLDSEEEREAMVSSKPALDEPEVSAPSARPASKIRPPSKRRAPPIKKEPSLSQSVPGAFIPDEEEDAVPPLPATPGPTTRRQARKPRGSAVKNATDTQDARKTSTRATRQSSRRSVLSASSHGSSSPEPASPERVTRSKTTKISAASTGSASASARTSRARKLR